jgi:hypothetical protein
MDVQLHHFAETSPPDFSPDVSASAIDRFDKRLTQEIAALRSEMRECEATLRRDSQTLAVALRTALEERNGELLKWGLLFWIGQAAATGTIVAGLLMLTFG